MVGSPRVFRDFCNADNRPFVQLGRGGGNGACDALTLRPKFWAARQASPFWRQHDMPAAIPGGHATCEIGR